MSQPAVRVEHLGKRYQIGARERGYATLRETLADAARAPLRRFRQLAGNGSAAEQFWALKDVSFEVQPGEVVGIIGRNGAGKSTLLKILSQITEPTEGRVELNGRVASLLEVGTGFHPELTGRENIYLNAAILGMRRREIDRKFAEIVEFSGVEEFLDTPVKRYSSGMQVRLAFAVAAHLDTELLIVDEVLAVGDAEFQRKCLDRMGAVTESGRTVLFVSHNMAAVRQLCNRAVLLRTGRVVVDTAPDAAIENYLMHLSATVIDAFGDNPERSGTGQVRMTAARVLAEGNIPAETLTAGRPAAFEFDYANVAGVDRCDMVMTIFNHFGVPVTHFSSSLSIETRQRIESAGTFSFFVKRLPLPPGQYRVAAALQEGAVNLDLIPNVLAFDVHECAFFNSSRVPDIKYCTCLVEHDCDHSVRS